MNIESQKGTFIHNLKVQISQQQIEIGKYLRLMKDDDEIISLQQHIKDAADNKVENGTMTVSDMLKELTALEIAKQLRLLHEIQHINSVYALNNITS